MFTDVCMYFNFVEDGQTLLVLVVSYPVDLTWLNG